jgi:acyl-CoA reductase-like NAD-dependent aldehyde dehydrogenase
MNVTVREPLGVVPESSLQSPLHVCRWKYAAPLAAGNTIVVAAGAGALSALRLANSSTASFRRAFNVVTAAPRHRCGVGRYPSVAKVAPIGSVAAGAVMRNAADTSNRYCLNSAARTR